MIEERIPGKISPPGCERLSRRGETSLVAVPGEGGT